MIIKTFDTKKQEEVHVGTFDKTTKTLNKKVSSKHFMVKEKGYGFQEEVIEILRNAGCEKIHIMTATQTLEFPFSMLLEKTPKDYGHGLQRFLKVHEAKIIKQTVQLPSYMRKA
jgi:hypothetical protein